MFLRQGIKERTCDCMSSRREDDWNPTVHVIGSPEPTQELLDVLAHAFSRTVAAENVRIRFRLNTVQDLRLITDAEIDAFTHEQLTDDEKRALRRLCWKVEAEHRTHPSGTYGKGMVRKMPGFYTRATALISEFCVRMVEWGCANYSPGSREWHVLDGLRSLNRVSGANGAVDWTAVVKIAQEIQEADGTVYQIGLDGFSLEFEAGPMGDVLYNISDVVAYIKRYAESRLAKREGAHAHMPAEANMQTLLGRLSKYIG
jgi:hypothetical protein